MGKGLLVYSIFLTINFVFPISNSYKDELCGFSLEAIWHAIHIQ